jgi:hypothetical protein
MTLRGYSVVLKAAEPLASLTGESEIRSRALPRRHADDELGLRPSALEARQALAGVTSTTASIDQQLALIEMLIAVGPEVRERGTLQESLRALEGMEDELGKSIAELLSACGRVRARGAGP